MTATGYAADIQTIKFVPQFVQESDTNQSYGVF
jgi:hypothetical protein